MKNILGILSVFFFLVACSSDDTITPEMQPITHEVLLFEFTPDTGNSSSRLQYEIKFSNPNSVAVNGSYIITLNSDGAVNSNSSISDTAPCRTIPANSDCIISLDEETSFDIGMIQSVELVSVEYYIE